MDMQNVSNLVIPEGNVNTIHNSDKELIWGRLAYDTKYAGNTLQNGTPTPTAPINVDVVTGTQTVRVIGKNAFNISTVTNNRRLDGSGNLINDNGYMTSDFIEVQPSTTYTYSRYTNGGGSAACCIYRSNKTSIQRIFWNGAVNMAKTNFQFTTDANTHYIRICDLKTLATLQVESGNVSTFYAPYQDHAYTVDLGTTELCKIGDSQDYIYKNGDGWYVHKATGKYTFTGGETIGKAGNTSNNSYYYASSQNPDYGFTDIDRTHMTSGSGSTAVIPIYAKYFGENSSNNIVSTDSIGISFNLSGASGIDCRIGVGLSSSINTAALLKTWLTNNTLSVYYQLATPTDTQITDTNLITQLNNIHQFLTRYGYNSNVSGNLPIIIDKTDLS